MGGWSPRRRAAQSLGGARGVDGIQHPLSNHRPVWVATPQIVASHVLARLVPPARTLRLRCIAPSRTCNETPPSAPHLVCQLSASHLSSPAARKPLMARTQAGFPSASQDSGQSRDRSYNSMIKFFLLAILAPLIFKALHIREVSL